MNKDARNANWIFFLFFLAILAGLAGTGPMCAGEGKTDLAAEAKKEAAEDAKRAADRATGDEGSFQRQFSGTFFLTDGSQQDNPEVIGVFLTDAKDKVPNQRYLVRVAKGGMEKETRESLKRYDLKKVEVQGLLRVGNKYLIVSAVVDPGAPPRAPARRSAGGI